MRMIDFLKWLISFVQLVSVSWYCIGENWVLEENKMQGKVTWQVTSLGIPSSQAGGNLHWKIVQNKDIRWQTVSDAKTWLTDEKKKMHCAMHVTDLMYMAEWPWITADGTEVGWLISMTDKPSPRPGNKSLNHYRTSVSLSLLSCGKASYDLSLHNICVDTNCSCISS